jgi:hypothetical protein
MIHVAPIKLSEQGKALAQSIADTYEQRHANKAPCSGFVNGVAMPFSHEQGQKK